MVAGPVQVFTKDDVKARWTERYTSDAINKKFLGLPRGIYLGFVPSPTGAVLDLKVDKAITFTTLVGSFVIGSAILGGISGATATIRVISDGYILVDNVVGIFQTGETVTSGPISATVALFIEEDVSIGRVVSSSALSAGRSDRMLDVVTTDTTSLDFTGFSDGTYYVILQASYEVGAATLGSIITRTTPEPSGAAEVLICVVTKVGAVLTVAATAPVTRHEPVAFDGTRIGFMPGGSITKLIAAAITTEEVIASRQLIDGTAGSTFDSLFPQTTGLPARLKADLSNVSMAGRLGKNLITVRGNEFTLAAPGTSANVSGSFAARNRDFEPYKDISPATGINLPAGVPVIIADDGSEFIDVVITGLVGTFTPGLLITGATSGGTAIVKEVVGLTLTLGDFVGSLFVGEVINQSGPPAATATVSTVSLREGAVTEVSGAVIESRNVATIVDSDTGQKLVNTTGQIIYGRVVYGPGGASNPGALTLAAGQQLNFTASTSTVVVAAGTINTPADLDVGDIIEGDDGRFYEISSVTGGPITSFDTPVAKPYVGPTAINVGSMTRHRYILEFYTVVAGAEVAATLPAGDYQFYFPAWFTAEKSNFNAALDAQPGEAPLSVRAQYAGTDTGSTLGATAISAPQGVLNFIEGADIGLVVKDDPATGRINITIRSTAVAPPAGLALETGTPPLIESGSGAANPLGSLLASASDHTHPASLKVDVVPLAWANSLTGQSTGVVSFTPLFGFVIFSGYTTVRSISESANSFGFITGAGQWAVGGTHMATGGGNGHVHTTCTASGEIAGVLDALTGGWGTSFQNNVGFSAAIVSSALGAGGITLTPSLAITGGAVVMFVG